MAMDNNLNQQTIMYSTFCRLCAETKSSPSHLNLYSDEEILQEIKMKLQSLNIVCDLSSYELYPNNVCLVCYNDLNAACEFKDKVTRAQRQILGLVSSNSTVLENCINVNQNILSDESARSCTDGKLFRNTEHLMMVEIKQEDLSIKQEDVENSWCNYLWMCSHCSKVCEDASQLRKHSIQEHDSCCAFNCADCIQTFDSYKEFTEHARNHRIELRNCCIYCNKSVNTDDCISHENWHERNSEICKKCGEIFSDDESLSVLSQHKHPKAKTDDKVKKKEKPIRRESDDSLSSLCVDEDETSGHDIPPKEIQIENWNEYPWICRICDVAFSSIKTLRAHMKMKHVRCAALKCLDCNDWFSRKPFNHFLYHVGTHRESLSKLCFYCNQEKPSCDELKLHVKKEHKRKIYCRKCGETFNKKKEVLQHLQHFETARQSQRQKNSEEDRKCKICNKVFTTHNYLRTHTERIHFRKTNFTCDQCGSTFYFITDLEHHKLTAHGNQRWNCRLCDKSFMRMANLRKHVRWHSTDKPFSCDDCGLGFKLKSLLKNHRAIHTNLKPFPCLLCGKTFRLKQYLKRHEIIHTGLKPYACKVCDAAYANRENCYNHMKKKHNIQGSRGITEVEFSDDAEEWKNSVFKLNKKGPRAKANTLE